VKVGNHFPSRLITREITRCEYRHEKKDRLSFEESDSKNAIKETSKEKIK